MYKKILFFFLILFGFAFFAMPVISGSQSPLDSVSPFPRPLETYGDHDIKSIAQTLVHRAKSEPFNVVASCIFLLAILHTFLTSRFLKLSHKWEKKHQERIKSGRADRYSVSHKAGLFHFLGEIEAVFGIWAAFLVIAIIAFFDWPTAVNYISHDVNFTEPMFVVVIMTLAATRPILKFAEAIMFKIANLLGGSLTAFWFTVLTLGPVLGSFITEPAAMTISALLLSSKLYTLNPSKKFKYATIGLLFVNISVGGIFTHFAAPPVLMVAGPWNWGMGHMFLNFGWKALVGMLLANSFYYLVFKKELMRLEEQFSMLRIKDKIQKKYLRQEDLETEFDKMECMVEYNLGFSVEFETRSKKMKEDIGKVMFERLEKNFDTGKIPLDLVQEAYEQRFEEIRRRRMRKTMPGLMPEHERPVILDPEWNDRDDEVPAWMVVIHILFMAWTIVNAHHPAIFVSGLLFFIGFAQVTAPYQNQLDLKSPMLVGFFLGGLVIHGGLQGWWIAPVLGSLSEIPLMISATVLTAFNDNAAITFLSTLVPGFTDSLKYSVVAGAVAGGGLTVIANAPNPAGQAILKKHFDNGVAPVKLLLSALIPTIIMIGCFLIF